MVETRRAQGADAAAAVEVWRAGLAAAGARPPAARVQEVAAQLQAPDALLVVAVDGPDEVVGFALGTWVRDGDGFVPGLLRLAQLVVHPRRRRAGTGTALAEALADAGWVRGARRLVAAPADQSAEAFLRACGLEPEGAELVGELEPPVRELHVRESGLRLGQLLKLAGLVETGAEGKALLDEGGVEVDGEVERRRGRQLRDGEVVVARDQAVRVVLPVPPPPRR